MEELPIALIRTENYSRIDKELFDKILVQTLVKKRGQLRGELRELYETPHCTAMVPAVWRTSVHGWWGWCCVIV